MFNIQAVLIAGLMAIALLTGVYFYGRADGAAACDARHEKAALDDFMKRTAEGEVLSAGLETDLSNSRNFYTDLGRQVSSEISSNDIYRSCILPANGVFLVNSAVAGKAAR